MNDSTEMKDPTGIGFPSGPFHSWQHLAHYVDQYLLANIDWTREISEKWEVCRTMEIRVIAAQDEHKARDTTRSVLDTLGRVFIGPPLAPPKYSHTPYTQKYLGLHNNGQNVRDIGIDNYSDEVWKTTGGLTQNMLPDSCPSNSQRLFGVITSTDWEINWSTSTSSSSHHEASSWAELKNLSVDTENEDSMMSLR